MQAAMQQAVVALAPAPAPAEDSEEQTVEESNQRKAAISTREWKGRECLGTQAYSSDHDAPDLKGQPVNILFCPEFQWIIKSCQMLRELRNEGPKGTNVCAQGY